MLWCMSTKSFIEGGEAGELLKGGGEILGEQGSRQTSLPDAQQQLLEELFKLKKMVIFNFSGGYIDLRECKKYADTVAL